MKRGKFSAGYTIVEVMIVLAVTGVLFGSAMVVIQGQTAKTQFSQAVNDLDSRIRDTINAIGTGNFPDVGGYDCTVDSNGPRFTSGSDTQGTRTDCTFIGKVIQFGVNKSQCTGAIQIECDRFDVYTVVGRRLKTDGTVPSRLQDEQPRVLDVTGSGGAVATQNLSASFGLSVTKIYSGATTYGSVGFFVSHGTTGAGNIVSGARSVDMVLVPGSSLGQTNDVSGAIGTVNALKNQALTNDINPPAGVVICLRGANGKRGAITIGSQNRQLVSQILIDQAPIGPGGCP